MLTWCQTVPFLYLGEKKHDLPVVLDLVGGFNLPEIYAFVVEDHNGSYNPMSRVENKKHRLKQPTTCPQDRCF